MTENPTPQKGDRVRITTAIEAEVRDADGETIRVHYRRDDGTCGLLVSQPPLPPVTRTIEVLTPEEPPINSVLLDRAGLAWQRLDDIWRSVDHDRYTWAYLQRLKPFNVIHRGGDDAD